MRYRILGTTEVHRPDGTAVPLGGPRLRALLTVLVLRAGRTVPMPLLVDEVWGAGPPADAAGAVQALVGRLRRAVGAQAVLAADGGYKLAADADDVDLYRFERLAADGARALDDGDPGKATALLDDALALWRGPVLADLPDREPAAARWEARQLDARRTRLAAVLALGRAEEALPELAALSDAHPLDEALHELRLRALRDAGRPAEALAAYEEVRRTLGELLGTAPGPRLRALHTALLDSPAAPEPVPPVPEAVAVYGNLPARLTSFVGREEDLQAVRDRLRRARLVTLLGPGGAGKTRLSQEAAEGLGDIAPDGVWLAELAPVDDPETVPEAVVEALGARETVLRGTGAEELRSAAEHHDDPLTRLIEHCAPRRMLLLLDNCEHLVGAAAHLAARLLERCPELTVLATSREPLGVPGEVLHPVEPLPQPVAERLLAERGAAARAGFRAEDDPAAVAEICRRLDGLPLAIELAAARLRLLTPRQIADRLDDRFRLLTGGARTVLPRQQTLRAVVDWSWELLDEEERTVLRRLSVFAGGCELPAAEAVCGAGALDALGSLVDKSLVVAAPSGEDGRSGMRYRMLETVAEYAGERLDEAGDRAAAERAHLVHYRELARTTDPLLRGPGQRAALALLGTEYENLRTALRRAVAARDEQEVLCLVLSLCWYWQIKDQRHETRIWALEAMALGPDPFAPGEPPAEPVYERPVDAPPPMRPELLAEARRGVHMVHLACMDLELGNWREEEAQARLRAIAAVYRPGLPQTCRSPGNLCFFAVLMTGGVDRVRELIDTTVDTCRKLDYRWELAAALQMRGNMLASRGDWTGDGARDAQESLEIFTELGDAWGMAEALAARGEGHERRGAYAEAAADYRAARDHTERLGARSQAAVLTVRLGNVLAEDGQDEAGEALMRQVVATGLQTANGAMPSGRLFLSMLLGRTGRTAEARDQLRLLREGFGAAGFSVFAGLIAGVDAWLDILDGEYTAGLATVREALGHAQAPMARVVAPQMAWVHLATAAIALAEDGQGARAADAVRLLGCADALLSADCVPNRVERGMRQQAEGAARARLDEADYRTAYAEGGGLTLAEAVALL
ncbi:BTAD domain-containing putative transcriptional regulator [Streptomyces sp. NPDC058045]|uniref:BTAD domain-containing putative transcriptional regulator n=1 Tax=Streptomyces sp. NPDC058045 TaxID=3346311 RepID=UPI0036F16A30